MVEPTYRAPTPPPPPPPEVFELPLGESGHRALLALGASAALTLFSLMCSRGAFFVFVVATGAVGALGMLVLSGGVRRLEVSAERVRVVFALRKPVELSTAQLEVQYQPPGELYLVTPEDTIEIDPRRLGSDEARCITALRAVARETVAVAARDVTPRRPRR